MLNRCACDNFAALWNMSAAFFGCGESAEQVIKNLGAYIKHVHFKDHRKCGDEFKLCSVGEGDISLIEILELLKKDNFNGCISIEHEKKWHPELSEPEVEFKRFAELVRPYMST